MSAIHNVKTTVCKCWWNSFSPRCTCDLMHFQKICTEKIVHSRYIVYLGRDLNESTVCPLSSVDNEIISGLFVQKIPQILCQSDIEQNIS